MISFGALTRLEGRTYRYGFLVLGSTSGQVSGVHVSNAEMIEVLSWCHEQFGNADGYGGITPTTKRWRADMTTVDFADPSDATAFRVRWC